MAIDKVVGALTIRGDDSVDVSSGPHDLDISAKPVMTRHAMKRAMIDAIKVDSAVEVRALLDEGYNLTWVLDEYGDQAIQLAARAGRTKLCRVLLAAGADVNSIGTSGSTALLNAVQSGNANTVRLFANAGANVDSSAEAKPLHVAAKGGMSGIVEMLLKAGARLHISDGYGELPLHWAARAGNDAVCAQLIAAAVDVTCPDSDGDTALHAAALAGQLSTCLLLIQNGADAMQSNDYGVDPSGACDAALKAPDAGAGLASTQQLLNKIKGGGPHYIAKGATSNYLTPFQHATRRGDMEYVQEVLLADPAVDLSQKTLGGKTLSDVCTVNDELRQILLAGVTARDITGSFGRGHDDGRFDGAPRRQANMLPI